MPPMVPMPPPPSERRRTSLRVCSWGRRTLWSEGELPVLYVQKAYPLGHKKCREDLVTNWEYIVIVQKTRNARLRRMPCAIDFRENARQHAPGRGVFLWRSGWRERDAEAVWRAAAFCAAAFDCAFAAISWAWDFCPGHSVASHERSLFGRTRGSISRQVALDLFSVAVSEPSLYFSVS